MKKNISTFSIYVGAILATFGFVYTATSAPPGSPYNLGETLAPTCAPGDANCTVNAPIQDGHNTSAQIGIDTTSITTGTKIQVNDRVDAAWGADTTAGQITAYLVDGGAYMPAIMGRTRTQTNTATTPSVGIYGEANHVGAFAFNEIRGGDFEAAHNGAGLLTNMYGLITYTETSSGPVTNAAGINVVANAGYGGGTIVNNYGIRIENQSGIGSSNYALYYDGPQKVVIDGTGKFGIGTDSPVDLLELQGDGDADINLTTYENGGTDNSTIHMQFANGSFATPLAVTDSETVAAIEGLGWDGTAFRDIAAIYMVTDGTTGATDTPGAIQFLTSTDGTSTLLNRMEIGNDGDVIINPGNATLSDEELHIAADLVGSSDTAISIENSNAGPTYAYEIHVEDTNEFVIYEGPSENSDFSVLMYNGATRHWGFGTAPTANELQMDSGAHITAGGVFTDASSRAFKTGIESITLEEAKHALEQLDPVRFQYKEQLGEEYLGFIAEDVPDLVATADRKGLAPMDIVAVLVKVNQDQQERIDTLEQELEALKQVVNNL